MKRLDITIRRLGFAIHNYPCSSYFRKVWGRFIYEFDIQRPIRSFEENLVIIKKCFKKILY